jgi:LuxR family transcriptional regulator, maltose regulon positive regulatory protein
MPSQVETRSAELLGRLLSTKLAPPPQRPLRVVRRRLTETLDAALDRPLILVAAPAGFGKTTLVADWLATSARRPPSAAWLALDDADNDPVRFWSYVIGALRTAQAGFGSATLGLLGVAEAAPLDEIVDELARDLAVVAEPLLLVLDDYHSIVSPAIHAGLASLLDRLLPAVHLVVSTRSDPPLPLARMRARAQITEVRATDLRFTPHEAGTFLTEVMGLALSPEQVAVLDARTEGWAAGLQLAGLSLQGRAGEVERAAFVDAFGGSHRFIVDYLVDEVLVRQPERIVSFLLRTSILERLSGPLCEAVTGEPDSQALLEEIERANLFLVSLDDERRWYRYHHLFADVLRHRLGRQSPKQSHLLHRRASAWCAANGLDQQAVEHALAAQDWPAAAQLIDPLVWVLQARGERETVRRWLLEIPEAARRDVPLLQVNLGHAFLSAGDFDKAAGIIDGLQRLEATPTQETLARALLLEANLAVQRGNAGQAIGCAEHALALLPKDDVHSRASAAVLLESAYLARGDLRAAERVFDEPRPEPDHAIIRWLLRSDRGVLDALRGQLHEAAQRHRELLLELGELPVVYAIEQRWRLATLHLEWNELQVAQALLDDALAGVARARAEVLLARIHLTRAHVALGRGDLAAADGALDEAAHAAERVGNALHVRWAKALRARLYLLRGDVYACEAWAAGVRGAGDFDSFEREPEVLVLARVELARGLPRAARDLFARVLERAEATGCESSAIRALVGQALVIAAEGQPDLATTSLRDALRRAEPGGFRRVFLDEGSALAPLLRRAHAHGSPLASTLLATFGAPAVASLVSAREQEVLVLLAEGLSNREIAQRLIVTTNTVKAHVRHLGTKLGSHSRTQLLARARLSGLLP